MRNCRLLLWVLFLLNLENLAPAFAQTAPMQRGVIDATSKPSTPERPGPYYALVIGIKDYLYLTKLDTTMNDANEIAQTLHDRYGFETTLLPNADRHDILSALDNYRRSLADNANLLIYYAGHGSYDKEMDKAYWAPVEAQKGTYTYADWILADEITARARAIPARHILVISDSCYSGMIAATREDSPTMIPISMSLRLDKMLKKKSRGVISSGGNEPVTDAGALGHSIFAYALLQGLKEIELNEFSADDLFQRFVKVQVAGKADQQPRYDVIRNSGDDFGDFVFFRLPVPVKPQPASGQGNTAKVLLEQAKALWASGGPRSAYPLFKQSAEVGNTEAMAYMGFYYDSLLPAYADVSKDDPLAATWYRKAAEAGEPWGMTNLGAMYRDGRGVPRDEVRAVSWYRKAAEAGNARGMASLGQMVRDGRGVAKDEVEAVSWYRKAAEAGDPQGMTNLGMMYRDGRGVAKDEVEAVGWYRKAAEAGDALGMTDLGWMYENGMGVVKDYVQAVSWYRKAAEAGEGWGMTELGVMYRDGRGVAKDEMQAVSWFRKAAEAGNAQGMTNLGWMYQSGKGVEKDYVQAASWYRKAAEAGDTQGMTNVGWMYEAGMGVEKDYGQAVSWYRKVAEAGDPQGMTSLGVMYRDGRGVAKDDVQALSWFRKAVEAGNARGMTNLGAMYRDGRAVAKDDVQALSWFRKAAEAGDAQGMTNLGWMYENGKGVQKDYAQAVSWYRKAASAGEDWAVNRLKELGER